MSAPEPLDADAVVQAEYERQLDELKGQYKAAETGSERRKLRRRIRRLRRHFFGRGVVRW